MLSVRPVPFFNGRGRYDGKCWTPLLPATIFVQKLLPPNNISISLKLNKFKQPKVDPSHPTVLFLVDPLT